MKIWVDAQMSPAIATGISSNDGLSCDLSVRHLGDLISRTLARSSRRHARQREQCTRLASTDVASSLRRCDKIGNSFDQFICCVRGE